MYLSRLLLNPRSGAVRRDLADCHQLHRTIMRAFPEWDGPDARARFGVLYRMEMVYRAPGAMVLVQSRIRPDWSGLPAGYLLKRAGTENPDCKTVENLYRSLEAGRALRFRLRANPTRKIDTKTGPDGLRRHGQRVELRGPEQQLDWLRRKGERCGFQLLSARTAADVPEVRTVAEGRQVGWRRQPQTQERARVAVVPVLFDGLLRIVDAAAFQEALGSGIGPGKAYGCGLLSIAPAGNREE